MAREYFGHVSLRVSLTIEEKEKLNELATIAGYDHPGALVEIWALETAGAGVPAAMARSKPAKDEIARARGTLAALQGGYKGPAKKPRSTVVALRVSPLAHGRVKRAARMTVPRVSASMLVGRWVMNEWDKLELSLKARRSAKIQQAIAFGGRQLGTSGEED